MAAPFPLIRHASRRVTPYLARLPVTANQITVVALLVGLAAAWAVSIPDPAWIFAGAVVFSLSYLLDHCDGEVARLKNQASAFGAQLDSFADWILHAAFFAGLGYGHTLRTDQGIWLWLGLAAAAGSTINYFLTLRPAGPDGLVNAPDESAAPSGIVEWVVFGFRELARADFWLIVLVLALFDVLWALLPAAAIGAQVYWIMQFHSRARSYRV